MPEPFFDIALGCEDLRPLFPSDVPRRNTLDGVTFVLVTDGKGGVEIDGRRVELEAGTLLALLPSHLLWLSVGDGHIRYDSLAFAFEFMDDFPFLLRSQISEKIDRRPCIGLFGENVQMLKGYLEMIAGHVIRKGHPSYREILRALVFVFVAEVGELYAHKKVETVVGRPENVTDAFFSLLNKHVRMHRKVGFYAGCLCITSKHLSKVISQVTGHAPSFWISDFVTKEAKALLKSSQMTVTELSELLNFPNSSFFARYFKRYTGVSPQEYREGVKIG